MNNPFKKLFGYTVKLKCENCGFRGEVKIPKGISVKKFINQGLFHCSNCGCSSTPKEYETQWLK